MEATKKLLLRREKKWETGDLSVRLLREVISWCGENGVGNAREWVYLFEKENACKNKGRIVSSSLLYEKNEKQGNCSIGASRGVFRTGEHNGGTGKAMH